MTTVPFTYLITHKPSGMKYYGVRYKRDCSPNDLWTTYFTSSKVVKRMIKQYGKDSFAYEIRNVFTSALDATVWEAKVHRRLRVDLREDWINQHAQSCDFNFYGHSHSSKTKEKIRRKMKARKLSAEHRRRISEASIIDRQRRRDVGWKMPVEDVERRAAQRRGKRRPGWVRKKISEGKKGTKRRYLPDGSFVMRKL